MPLTNFSFIFYHSGFLVYSYVTTMHIQSYQFPINFHRVEAFVNSSECFIGEKDFYIQAVGKIIAGRRYCSFVPPFLFDDSGAELPAD